MFLNVTGSFMGTRSRIIVGLLCHRCACLRAKLILGSFVLDILRNRLIVVGTGRLLNVLLGTFASCILGAILTHVSLGKIVGAWARCWGNVMLLLRTFLRANPIRKKLLHRL